MDKKIKDAHGNTVEFTSESALHEVASACAEVFEITGRSVPSNHQAKINTLAKKMSEIAKLFPAPVVTLKVEDAE